MKLSAILVNPVDRTLREVALEQDSYDDIRALFGPDAALEGNTLCKLKESIYLMTWGDCNEFIVGPAWRSVWNPAMSMHGLTLVTAGDITTGSSVAIPLSLGEFELSIEWENWRERIDPRRPNKEWVDLITAAERDGMPKLRTWKDLLDDRTDPNN